MNYIAQLLAQAREAIKLYPEHRCEIIDCYQLARAEIEDGESPAHEFELFMNSIAQMREELRYG